MKLNGNGCFVRISVSCREVLTNTADVQPRRRVENEPETGVTSSLEGHHTLSAAKQITFGLSLVRYFLKSTGT